MAGLDCSKIKTGFINQVCGKPAIAGTTARVILLSYSDVDKSKSVVTDNVISSLILKTGATGYEVDSLPNATVGSDTINAGTYLKTHQHNVVVRIFKKSEAAKKFVNGLTNARVIAIVENNDTGDNGDTKYEVYGWDSGLELTEITVTTEMTDGVTYQVTLANGTIAQEGSLPMSLFAFQGPILGLVSSQSFEHVSHECYGLDPLVRSPSTMRSVVASSVTKRLIGSEPS